MKGYRYFMLSLCSFMLTFVFVLPPVLLPPTLAGVPLLVGTPTPNFIVYLPSMFNQYSPPPRDFPIYRNSFEDVTDMAASGITSSNATVRITTENVDFASGSKALEVYGTLPGPQWSIVSADFSMKKFIGEDTLDLSDKTIGFSVFIPNDSSIDIVVFVARKGDITVNLSAAQTYGEWVDVQYDVEEAYQNGSLGYTNGSDEEARDVIKHCETITIQGVRSTAGTSAEAKFYFDNLNWIRSDRFNLPVDDSIDSLRKYAADEHFEFGLFSADSLIFGPEDNPDWHGDPWYAYLVAQEGAVNTFPHNFSQSQTKITAILIMIAQRMQQSFGRINLARPIIWPHWVMACAVGEDRNGYRILLSPMSPRRYCYIMSKRICAIPKGRIPSGFCSMNKCI